MSVREIPREEWAEFFDAFTRQHRGWRISLDIIRSDIGAQVEARDVPFDGITLDHEGDGPPEVSIMIGEAPERHLVRTITGAERVRLRQTEEGGDEALDILSEKGTRTVIRFGHAMPPELLDGVSIEEMERLGR